ncbi:MAG: ABC transporter permease [Paludibacteraceae bacterium]|nr:ABC transporter permease [Paludibacteraceae bacterium]
MKSEKNTYWTTEISPNTYAKGFGLLELWRKRYLIWLFIKRDITVQFKQTIFGMGWYFISPLFTMFMYIVVFGRIAGIPTDEVAGGAQVPQPVFYLSGICLWEYFSTCLTEVSGTFQKNAGLFGKVYFPRLVSPVSVVASKLFRFSLQLATFVFVYLLFVFKGVHLRPTIYLLLFPALVIMIQMLALGLGLIISSMTTKYRDLTNFFGVFVSLWMYATPIVYPLSYVTNPTLHKIMLFNPMTAIIETFKYGAYGAGEFSWMYLGYSLGIILVLLVIGISMFNRKQKFFIDTI